MIDWARIRILFEEIGEESFAEVLDLFVQDVDEGLERLECAGDKRAVSAEFHFLKGAALNLGLDDIAALCAEGERCAAQGADTSKTRAQVSQQFACTNKLLVRDWRQHLCPA